MNLLKPPIVEMWVEFKFEPNPRPDVQSAITFLQSYSEEFPEIEVSQENRLEFRQVSPTKLPEMWGSVAVKHLRARGAESTRWMHLTPTQLVCNFLRLGENYPGFETLRQEAVKKLTRYIEICQPVKLRNMAIHYVDVIDVPIPPSREILLSDWFALGVDLPRNPFGSQVSFLVRTEVAPADGTGPLEMQLQLDSLLTEEYAFRFRMDWHKVCPYDGEIDFERIPVVLQKAHGSVMKCFRQAFTAPTWKLFQPQE